jgi:hypothetical protein
MKRTAFKRKPLPLRPCKTIDYAPRPRAAAVAVADTRARMVVPVDKVRPVTHEPYRRLVAALPCIHCGAVGRSQAAHGPALGRGKKADDRTCVPLCADQPGAIGCHTKADQYQLFNRWERARQFAEWGAMTRALIVSRGLWPKTLPQWESASAVLRTPQEDRQWTTPTN